MPTSTQTLLSTSTKADESSSVDTSTLTPLSTAITSSVVTDIDSANQKKPDDGILLNGSSNISNNLNHNNNNLLIETNELKLVSSSQQQQHQQQLSLSDDQNILLKSNDGGLSCLTASSASSNINNGSGNIANSVNNMLASCNSYPEQQNHPGPIASQAAMWSSADDSNNSHNMSTLNGFGGFQNYSSQTMFNNVAQQQQRRAITANHGGGSGGGGYHHHNLSPNSNAAMGRVTPLLQNHQQNQPPPQNQQQQQQQQQHQQQQYKNSYPAWSNPPPSVGWPGPNQSQNHMGSWNRGRSVPNLNPMSGLPNNRKPNSPNPAGGNNPFPPGVMNQGAISPVKYRRSTSFPGKHQHQQQQQQHGGGSNSYQQQQQQQHQQQQHGGAVDGSGMDDVRDNYMQYQDCSGMGNGLDMRSLEHCLSDIMRGVGSETGPPDHLKGFLTCGSNALQSLAQLHGKPYYQGIDDHIVDEAGGFVDGTTLPLGSPSRSSPNSQGSETGGERFSRKVFVGGLPPDIDEDEITSSFRRFGPLVVDWPHKAESKSYFPPKGYAFLLFQDESSVQQLIEACITDDEKLYLCVSSPTIKDKPVQIRPWRLSDADFVLDASMPLDPRKTVFVGGVPRPLKAIELAMIMDRLYGGVCYAGIDTDPELKYPKGAGRVAFSNQQSYIAAISARFVQLQHGDIDKRVEVKPYVLDDQMCDECQGQRCGGKFAPFFCANVTCLQYYCEHCWATIHSRPGREYHKPLVKEGADRPRGLFSKF